MIRSQACGTLWMLRSHSLRGLLLFLIVLALGQHGTAQTVESANAGRTMVYVGGGASGFTVQYGQRKLIGPAAWVDVNSIRPLGFEAEGRWLDWHQQANVHAETYLAGARYRFHVGRMQPYAKGLVGIGLFNFPYNFASGKYFVVAPGGGVDYRLTSRMSARADFEYQIWPQFTFGSMSSVGATIGIRYRVF